MGVSGDDFCRQPGHPGCWSRPHPEGALVVGEIAPAAWIRGQGGQGVGSTGLEG